MNKKGYLILGLTVPVFAWSASLLCMVIVSQMPCVKDNFRTRKATEKCISSGVDEATCKTNVAGMSKEVKLDYIRDK